MNSTAEVGVQTTEKNGQGQAKGSFVSRFKIGARIYAGFAVVLILLAGLAAFSIRTFYQQEDQFARYSDMASDAGLVAELKTDIETMRIAQLKYISSSAEAHKNAFLEDFSETRNQLEQTKKDIQNPERVALLKKLEASLSNYKNGFDEVSALIDQRNDLVYNQLGPVGLKVRKNLSEIREGAFAAQDYESASFAGIAQENLLLARLYVMKFLDDNSEETAERVGKELSILEGKLSDLEKSLQNPQRRRLLAEIEAAVPVYAKSFKALTQAIWDRNKIRDGAVYENAVAMYNLAGEIDVSAKKTEAVLKTEVHDGLVNATNLLFIIGGLALLIGLVSAFLIARGITKPVLNLTNVMGMLANQDLTVEVPGKDRHDELGEMAQAVEVFKENGIRAKELEAEQEAQKQQAEVEKRNMMMQLADEFDQSIGGVVTAVSSASAQLNSSAKLMADVSEETEKQAAEASAASEQTSGSVQTVATATEEMTSTISEITQQVSVALTSSRDAVDKVNTTNQQMVSLAETSSRIGAVVEMISNIAEQTNLLALNATIESARAGEAGKGFAVVAGEVKALAGQTAKATEEIAQQITGIQAATKLASSSMDEVSSAIQQVDEISTAIASAMEEQNAATSEIASSIHQAAQGTEVVNENVGAVSRASKEAGSASEQVMTAAKDLATQSELLKTSVDSFIEQVRAG